MAHELTLGSFLLTDMAGLQWGIGVNAGGASRGAPVPVDVAVQSWLQDGSVVVTQGYDNREVALQVEMFGSDLAELAACEAALFAELGKPNTLTWTPPDGFGPPSVFEVITSSMEHAPDEIEDYRETTRQPTRTYNLRLVCKAFVRSAAETVAQAEKDGNTTTPPTITTTTVDDGSSASGWSAAYQDDYANPSPVPATVQQFGGTVNTSTPLLPVEQYTPNRALSLTRSGLSVDVSSKKQLKVRWFWDTQGATAAAWRIIKFNLVINGNRILKPVAGALPDRYVAAEYTYAIPADVTTITSVAVAASFLGNTWAADQYETLFVDQITVDNANQASGTPRQLLRTLEVKGSARAQGSVSIEHEVSALGDVLAYFWPDDESTYSPPLRQYRIAGGSVTADNTTVSGARETAAGLIWETPASRLPTGAYVFMARLRGASAGDASFAWAATTYMNGVQVGPINSGGGPITVGTGWGILPLARMHLPTRDLDPAAIGATVRVLFSTTGGTSGTVELDEAWLFNRTIGQLSAFSCGTGTPTAGGSSNRAWLDAPTVITPRPTLRVGYSPTRADSFYPLTVQAWQPPQFVPPKMRVLTVTTNALNAKVAFRSFPSWHTHAAE